jgi:hypothetical protein
MGAHTQPKPTRSRLRTLGGRALTRNSVPWNKNGSNSRNFFPRTLPLKRKQLRILFCGTRIEANFRIAVPNHSAEEKTTQNKTRQLKIVTLGGFCHTGIFAGFSLHIINFAVRSSKAAMRRGNYMIRVLHSSFSVRCNSGGCSVAQRDAA